MWQHRKLTNIKIFRGTKQKFMSPLRSTSLRNDLAEAVSNAMNTNGLSWNDLAIGKGKKEQIIIRCISTGCKKSISPIQNKNLFFLKVLTNRNKILFYLEVWGLTDNHATTSSTFFFPLPRQPFWGHFQRMKGHSEWIGLH